MTAIRLMVTFTPLMEWMYLSTTWHIMSMISLVIRLDDVHLDFVDVLSIGCDVRLLSESIEALSDGCVVLPNHASCNLIVANFVAYA